MTMDEKINFNRQYFDLVFKLAQQKEPEKVIDEDFFTYYYKQADVAFPKEARLTDEEKIIFERNIKSIYGTFQGEDGGLIGDYEHDFHWYENLCASEEYEEYYWLRYRQYLSDSGFNPVSLDVLTTKTLPDLMSYIGNPNEDSEFSIRGLVVGDVQSGKTSNYIGLMTKAADAGYRVIILLTGTIESLRRQTQIRVEEGFIGYDAANLVAVGVGNIGNNSRMPQSPTNRTTDFTGTLDRTTYARIRDNSGEPMIFVVKKNQSVLAKMYNALKKLNTTNGQQRITAPLLLIDDEADNASVNTGKTGDDPTKINSIIRKLLRLFARNTYIGYTATPFANVFIAYDSSDEMLKDDLFPRNFIYSLGSPSSYSGPQKYFKCPESECNEMGEGRYIRYINDADLIIDGKIIFPPHHTKEWHGTRLFDSFYRAINLFLLANAIRDIRDIRKNTHRTMLINMSRFMNVHSVIQEITDEYLDNVRIALKLNCMYSQDDALGNKYIKGLYDTFKSEYEGKLDGQKVTWEQVYAVLPSAIAKITTAVVNSSRVSTKLDYVKNEKNGLRVIAIGGLALSRGLTLEGLCTSYFYRDTSTFDVLMQMGRWFGYHTDFEDLCRIYLTKESCDYYKEISDSIDVLKKDIITMGEQGKRPDEYGIRVRNNSPDLLITARNKSRSSVKKVDRQSFFGGVFETPYIHRDLDIVLKNINATSVFIDSFLSGEVKRDEKVIHPYYRNIPSEGILSLLNSIIVHEANTSFEVSQIVKFIKRNPEMQFDVLFMGGDGKKSFSLPNKVGDKCIGRHVDVVDRGRDVNNQIIRISKVSARLGAKDDTKLGLSYEDVKSLPSASKAQDYMIEGRNPLFIIYYVQLLNEYGQCIDIENMALGANVEEDCDNSEELLCVDMKAKQIPYLIGYGIGFPRNKFVVDEPENYYVNRTCSYYDRQRQEDIERYGEDS